MSAASAFNPPLPERRFRVLIANDETLQTERLATFLSGRGFEVRKATNGKQVEKAIDNWRPDFAVYDLMLADLNAMSFLKYLKKSGTIGPRGTQVIVVSGHNSPDNIRECMRLGAIDYLIKPIVFNDVLSRLVLHLQSKRDLQDPADLNQETAQYYLYLTDLLLREALKGEESLSCLHNLTGMLGMSLKAVRVSIVRCDLETRRGFVMASNDKRSIGGLAINLVKYPEMIYVLREGKTLAVDNLAGDPTLYFVTQQHKEISFNSMLVCPVQIAGQNWGVLSVRMPEVKKQLHDFEIRFAQLVAHVAALIVRMDPTLQTALPPVDLGKP